MSAIWGAIHLEGKKIPEEFGKIFHKRYQDCVIDKTEILCEGSVLMGCEHQFFTSEAGDEKLPFREEDGSCFVADVFLDNREELLRGLGDEAENGKSGRNAGGVTDGEILRRIFEADGAAGIKKTRGSFAFVHYDAKSRRITMAMDQLANRCLYYALVDRIFYFSTLMDPIAELCKGKLHVNQTVFEDFLANSDRRVYLDPEATVFLEIRHAKAGEILHVSGGEMTKESYWEPLKEHAFFRKKEDATYQKELRALLSQAVERSLRSAGEVGIFLSGGLDSTAVACVAGPKLSEKGKKLYAYTMVPMAKYQDDTGERVNVDERELVHATALHLGNVEEHYESLEQVNSWDCMKEQLDLLEGPFKSMQNVMMLGKLGRMARADGCRIVLNGQLGNDTISYGDTAGFLYELFRYGHWLRLWKETGKHSKYFRYNRKKVLLQIWERLLSKEDCLSYQDFQKQMLLTEYSPKRYRELTHHKKIRTRKEYLGLILDKMRFRQIGDNETRMSLYAGVLIKDPTRDVDLLEWCLRLPAEQFNKNCTNRRLIYDYLADLMTPEILDQRLPKGRQSADEFYRLEAKKEEMYRDMRAVFEKKPCPVLDQKKLLAFLEEHRELFMRKTCTEAERKALETLLYAYEACLLHEKYFST